MTAEEKLAKIAAIYNAERKVRDYNLSTHAGSNLDGAIIDLERTRTVDDVSLRTLKRVRGQLRQIEEILGI